MPVPGGPARRRAALALILAAAAGCGRKGPPLPPFVRVPEAVGAVSVQRLGDEALVTVRLPTRNVDGSTPVDLSRVRLYAYTAAATPTPARLIEAGALVATWEPPDASDGEDGAPTRPAEITLRDVLEPAELVVAPPAPTSEAREPGPAPAAPPSTGLSETKAEPVVPSPPSRYYLVVPFGARDRAGALGRVVALELDPLPEPPAFLLATYDERAVTLMWTPVAAGDDESPVRYNVYSRPQAARGGETPVVRPAPRNGAPLSESIFREPITLDGGRHCFEVRAVRGDGPSAVVGRPSREACVPAVDTFAPAAPAGLTAIERTGAIELTWVANQEPDLAGYVVLRGEPGDATLTVLTAEPITDTRYVDRDVRLGVRYIYAVKAVDTQPRPNESRESVRLERTAR